MENSLIWIRLDSAESNKKAIHIAILYAPTATPHTSKQTSKISSFYEELNSAISSFRSHGHVILVGDFNARLGQMTGDHASNRNMTPFLDCLEEHCLTNVNITHCYGQYTFENQSNGSRSIIDFLLTDLPAESIKYHKVLPIILGTSSQSAHHPLFSVLRRPLSFQPVPTSYRSQWRAITYKSKDKFASSLSKELNVLPSEPKYKDLRSALNRANLVPWEEQNRNPKLAENHQSSKD